MIIFRKQRQSIKQILIHDYTKMQQRLMELLMSSDSSLITCKKASESVQCNGTCLSERNQLLDVKSGQSSKTYDLSSFEFEKVSPNVIIMATKLPMNNRTLLTREIWFKCPKDNCKNLQKNRSN
ncbi:hypothetical protein I4U23_009145 [Adineta vaga]|nr:hypothetical protein I4U23_009145 [Adineta vaga]